MIAVLGCLQAGAFNHCTRVIPRLFVAILTVISDAFQVLSEALSIYSSPVTSLYPAKRIQNNILYILHV